MFHFHVFLTCILSWIIFGVAFKRAVQDEVLNVMCMGVWLLFALKEWLSRVINPGPYFQSNKFFIIYIGLLLDDVWVVVWWDTLLSRILALNAFPSAGWRQEGEPGSVYCPFAPRRCGEMALARERAEGKPRIATAIILLLLLIKERARAGDGRARCYSVIQIGRVPFLCHDCDPHTSRGSWDGSNLSDAFNTLEITLWKFAMY